MNFEIPKNGTICWRELTTPNLEKAKEFYSQLLGWNLEQSKLSPVEYPEISVDGTAIGGMLKIDSNWGEGWEEIPPYWATYIAVDDCDATAEAVKANGGTILCPPFDAPNVGRISMASDPSGANFTMIQFVKT